MLVVFHGMPRPSHIVTISSLSSHRLHDMYEYNCGIHMNCGDCDTCPFMVPVAFVFQLCRDVLKLATKAAPGIARLTGEQAGGEGDFAAGRAFKTIASSLTINMVFEAAPAPRKWNCQHMHTENNDQIVYKFIYALIHFLYFSVIKVILQRKKTLTTLFLESS